jgi:hypothetical protein
VTTFSCKITRGNNDMRTVDDIAEALRRVAGAVEQVDSTAAQGLVRDETGVRVGEWYLTVPEDPDARGGQEDPDALPTVTCRCGGGDGHGNHYKICPLYGTHDQGVAMPAEAFHHVILTAAQLKYLRALVAERLQKLVTHDINEPDEPVQHLRSELMATTAKILNEIDLAQKRGGS